MLASARGDVELSDTLGGERVRTGQSCHNGQKTLPLFVIGVIVQSHGEAADWAREALRHLFDSVDRPVFEARRDDSGFVDAGAAILAGEWVRTHLELPIQDVIKAVHDAHPCASPLTNGDAPSRTCETQEPWSLFA